MQEWTDRLRVLFSAQGQAATPLGMLRNHIFVARQLSLLLLLTRSSRRRTSKFDTILDLKDLYINLLMEVFSCFQ